MNEMVRGAVEARQKGGVEGLSEFMKVMTPLVTNIEKLRSIGAAEETKATTSATIDVKSEKVKKVAKVAEAEAEGKRKGTIKAEDELSDMIVDLKKRIHEATADFDKGAAAAERIDKARKEKGGFLDKSIAEMQTAWATSQSTKNARPLRDYTRWYNERAKTLNKNLPDDEKIREIAVAVPRGDKGWQQLISGFVTGVGPDFPILVDKETGKPLAAQESILKSVGAQPAQITTPPKAAAPPAGIKWKVGGGRT
jgi:hypothetical protein